MTKSQYVLDRPRENYPGCPFTQAMIDNMTSKEYETYIVIPARINIEVIKQQYQEEINQICRALNMAYKEIDELKEKVK